MSADHGHDRRSQPRFVTRDRVELFFAERGGLQELWITNISKGGLFVGAERPPELGTIVEVRLQTRDGSLHLTAEVVHRAESGAGLQFIDLDAQARLRIENYLAGLASLGHDERPTKPSPSTDDLFDEAQLRTELLEQGQLYDALSVQPSAEPEVIQARAEQVRQRLQQNQEMPPPKRARMESTLRKLMRAEELLLNPTRRLHYDFLHGHVRAAERLEAGESPEKLREAWRGAHPNQLKRAEQLFVEALQLQDMGDREEALSRLRAAQRLDPFNCDLARLEAAWQEEPASAAPDPHAQNRAGLELLKQGAFVEARGLFGAALKQVPDSSEFAINLASAWLSDPSLPKHEAVRWAAPLVEAAKRSASSPQMSAKVQYWALRLHQARS